MEEKVYLTEEGLSKLRQELEDLKTVKRKEIAEKLKVALSFGDISENAEYDTAKNEQSQLEARILQLENKLMNVVLIDKDSIDKNTVRLGASVKVCFVEDNEEVTLTLVGTMEVDPFNNKISNESPIGKALIGKEKGEVVQVTTPEGIMKILILEIL